MKSLAVKYLVVFIFGMLSGHAQMNLAYNLKQGDRFKIFQKADQNIVQDMEDTTHIVKNSIEGDFSFYVISVNDSVINVNFKFDRFKMNSTSNLAGNIMSVNTADLSNDEMQDKLFSGLTKTTLKMVLFSNGKIKSISGTEKLISRMVDAAGDMDEFTKELMKEAMKTEFGNESLSQSFEQLTYIYPTNSVKVGDSWQNAYTGDLSSENTWTLKGLTNGVYKISGKSKVHLITDDESVSMDLEGTMTSAVETYKSNGFIKSMETSSSASGLSTMKSMQGMKLPTTVNTKTTYKTETYVQ
ncbi:hypothetical protein ESY86_17035 [Subsaximicrobium wynnwilliamsii]|uniref:Uncharacterized protein n=1 Tax=Subsaximicrobium wynnwilliamsii TaxID=291179 RepID=A0A5C6ZBJ3_9FLAO|nr:DUF6263 family protein [Subsaximicrobium wynnwilliamsii]TXD83277.1 hypothetical protein ESY87_09905 [Subsaximicrobium wynnwilliamsii]TXD87376.1 hypothetical protein ESY86_17035 [Subsaximicrobium wynnwilliamsii]TXE03300.1 hypothetical protein ESY88_08200 [Subsaximicrobium wynnwilliamsii]